MGVYVYVIWLIIQRLRFFGLRNQGQKDEGDCKAERSRKRVVDPRGEAETVLILSEEE